MRTSTRKAKLLIGILLCGYLFSPIALKAQQGSEFWFDVPEINRGHVIVSAAKFLVYLHVTNVENFDVTVTLQLPAEPSPSMSLRRANAGFRYRIPSMRATERMRPHRSTTSTVPSSYTVLVQALPGTRCSTAR